MTAGFCELTVRINSFATTRQHQHVCCSVWLSRWSVIDVSISLCYALLHPASTFHPV